MNQRAFFSRCPDCHQILSVQGFAWPEHLFTHHGTRVVVDGWFPTIEPLATEKRCANSGNRWKNVND